jgi:putative phosphoribosyl transferase
MKAAIETVKSEHASKIVVAIPVAPMETIGEMKKLVNEVICLATPPFFEAIGQYYDNFYQVEDEEVSALLEHTSIA